MRIKSYLAIIACSFAAAMVFAGSVAAQYSGGTGDPNTPWQIDDPNDLIAMGGNTQHYGDHFILTADIDMAGMGPEPDGSFTTAVIASDTASTSDFQGEAFTGTFDGGGFVIRNLVIDDGGAGNDYLGLFGYVDGGEVRDLGLEGGSVTGGGDAQVVGGLAGYSSGTISSCYATSEITGNYRIGGLLGYNYAGTLLSAYASGTVTGHDRTGGLVGDSVGEMTSCFATGAVNGDSSVGGLAGRTRGSLTSCYATGSVAGGDDVGGLVGYKQMGTISSCYASGRASGDRDVGGLVGDNRAFGAISSCHATGQVTGAGDVGGLVGISYGEISSCYATGVVIGNVVVGGLVGVNYDGAVSSCYATGTASGSNQVGGLVGANPYGTVSSCYSTGSASSDGGPYLGGLVGDSRPYGGATSSCYFLDTTGPDNGPGVPLSDAELRQQVSIVGFDFAGPGDGDEDLWNIYETLSYPYLKWQTFDGSDCNGNGVPDSLELIQGADCNGNGVPDTCETVGGGDFDADGDVDLDDFTALSECMAGPGVPPSPMNSNCVSAYLAAFDADTDGDVDLADYAAFAQLPAVASTAVIRYVHATAPGANTGMDWYNAYTDLQTALTESPGVVDQIWVAADTYTPTVEVGGTGAQYRAFQLVNGVAVHGGFSGTEDPATFDLADRDFEANETILSGDIGTPGDASDNCYHVFYHPDGTGLDSSAVLDGVTIAYGHAHGTGAIGDGGGMYNHNSSPTLVHCKFDTNDASWNGGGVYNYGSSPSITKCTFIANSAGCGGGLSNSSQSSPTLTDCVIVGNTVHRFGVGGGGIYNHTSNPTIINCAFSGNSDYSVGFWAGGMVNHSSSPVLVNCTFSKCSYYAMHNLNGSNPTLTNCIIWEGGIQNDNSAPVVTYSCVQGGYAGTGNIDAYPYFIDADGPDDIEGTLDDDLRLQNISPCIDAGDNAAIPSGVTTDLDGGLRVMDDPDIVDTGAGTAPIVDMGVHEGHAPHAIVYVAADAGGANNGTSWDDAYTDLHVAMSSTLHGDVWIKAGTYYPSVEVGGSGARYQAFQMKNAVAIYGGFTGIEDPNTFDLNDRDLISNVTVLSGDVGTPEDRADNCYHVFYHPPGLDLNDTAILDGVTITRANADGGFSGHEGSGGGMFNHSPSGSLQAISPTLTNCTFEDNSARYAGGAMYNLEVSNPVLTNCTFSGNAPYVLENASGASPTIINCTFSGNAAAAIRNNVGCSPILINCILWGNGGPSWAQVSDAYPTNYPSAPVFSHCNIGNSGGSGAGWDAELGTDGGGNIDADPQFLADPYPGADGQWGTADDDFGDLDLLPGSPCIDAGENDAIYLTGVVTDIGGRPRFIDDPSTPDSGSGAPPMVDIGAFEYE